MGGDGGDSTRLAVWQPRWNEVSMSSGKEQDPAGCDPGNSVLHFHLPGALGALSTPGCLWAGLGCPLGCSPNSHWDVGRQSVILQSHLQPWGAPSPQLQPVPVVAHGRVPRCHTVLSCSHPSLMHTPPNTCRSPPALPGALPVSPCPHRDPSLVPQGTQGQAVPRDAGGDRAAAHGCGEATPAAPGLHSQARAIPASVSSSIPSAHSKLFS